MSHCVARSLGVPRAHRGRRGARFSRGCDSRFGGKERKSILVLVSFETGRLSSPDAPRHPKAWSTTTPRSLLAQKGNVMVLYRVPDLAKPCEALLCSLTLGPIPIGLLSCAAADV